MGKRSYLFYILGLFLGLFLATVIFLGPQKTKAADTDVIVNEVMANPQGSDTNHEWLEIANFGQVSVNLKDWKIKIFNDPVSTTATKTINLTSIDLSPQSFLVVVNNSTNYKPCDNCVVFDAGSYTITNAKGKISLTNAAATWEYNFSWTEDVGDGRSMEIIGPPKDSTYGQWQASLVDGGTPGAKNSVSGLNPPQSPTLVSPTLAQKFSVGDKVTFLWQTSDNNVSFEILVSQNGDLSDPIIVEPNLALKTYEAEDLEAGIYYWQILASNGVDETGSAINSFEMAAPVYSNDIIINELYPDPQTGDEEWIELYNNSTENVDFKNWLLEDLKGSIHQYKITSSLIIPAWGFIFISHNDSGITLNNDQDGVRLTRPDGQILYETPVFAGGDKGWSFARNSAGTWEWTTTITPAAVNIITPPVLEDAGGDEKEIPDENIPLNSESLVIQTGEFRDYENYLVTITGEVIETSGNTFYLDDGSGMAKVYIQDATGIDKPPMHKGDIFEVTGIVNLYRQTWRILPQKQEDIKLIQAAIKTASGSSVIKKASAKSTSTKSPTTSATARSPTGNQQIASASDSGSVQVAGLKSPWWIQMIKAITGLAAVLLIIIVIRLRRWHRENPQPSDFGDET